MRRSITRCRKLSDTWYIPKYSKIYSGWEKQGKGPEGATGHLTACSGSLKSPDSLDLTPIVRFWIWFFSASLFLKARKNYFSFIFSFVEIPGWVCAMLAATPPCKIWHKQHRSHLSAPETSPSTSAQHSNNLSREAAWDNTHRAAVWGVYWNSCSCNYFSEAVDFCWRWGALQSRGKTGLVVLVWRAELWVGKELKAQRILHEAPVVYNKSKVYFLYGLAHRG